MVSLRALPLSIVGRLVARASGSTEPLLWSDGAVFVRARGFVARWLARVGHSAIAIGEVVLVAGEPRPVPGYLVRHELAHVRQARRWGPLFWALYLGAWIVGLVRTGDRRLAYRLIPWEVEAREAEAALPGHDEDA